MLPSASKSLLSGGMPSKAAAWTVIGCFLGGVFGIQVLSRIIHHFMPSHVVDCDHEHENEGEEVESHHHDHNHAHHKHNGEAKAVNGNGSGTTERTPLLNRSMSLDGTTIMTENTQPEMADVPKPAMLVPPTRPSFKTRTSQTLGTVSKFVAGSKLSCDAGGPCFGYSDPCGRECFKNISLRGGTRARAWGLMRPTMGRHANSTTMVSDAAGRVRRLDHMGPIDEEAVIETLGNRPTRNGSAIRSASENVGSNLHFEPSQQQLNGAAIQNPSYSLLSSSERPPSTTSDHDNPQLSNNRDNDDDQDNDTASIGTDPPHKSHHHHVPQNAFLSLSLQTSIAIAVHKLPEGFITYATNHANPKLGFTVFVALAIHNISEGFSLALPLFLATNSHIRALLYSFVLGGLSQPLGAGIAALTLKLAEKGRGEWAPGERMYGAMFAVTAGIMASVALSLLQESLELGHRKGLCVSFVFVGMGVLGVSSALTA